MKFITQLSLTLACSFALLAPLHAATPVVGDDNAAAVRSTPRVAIIHYGAEFYRELYAEGRGGGATARVTADLLGVSDQTLQQLADQGYADTVAALTAAGFQVVPAAEVNALPAMQAYAAKHGKPSPLVFEDEKMLAGGKQISGIFSSAGQPAYFSSSTARGDFAQRVFAQNGGLQNEKVEIARALNANLLEVHYLASFGTLSQTRNGWVGLLTNRARAGIKPEPTLYANDTQWQIIAKDGARIFTTSSRSGHAGAVYLKEPLVADTNILTLEETTTQAQRDEQTYANFLNAALGNKVSERGSTGVVRVSSEADFRATYSALIANTAQAFARQLAGQ